MKAELLEKSKAYETSDFTHIEKVIFHHFADDGSEERRDDINLIVQEIYTLYKKYKDKGHLDNNWLSELKASIKNVSDKQKYIQRFIELFVLKYLCNVNNVNVLKPKCGKNKKNYDFLVEHNAQKFAVEVTSPDHPKDLDNSLNQAKLTRIKDEGELQPPTDNAIKTRLTGAIRSKVEKYKAMVEKEQYGLILFISLNSFWLDTRSPKYIIGCLNNEIFMNAENSCVSAIIVSFTDIFNLLDCSSQFETVSPPVWKGEIKNDFYICHNPKAKIPLPINVLSGIDVIYHPHGAIEYQPSDAALYAEIK